MRRCRFAAMVGALVWLAAVMGGAVHAGERFTDNGDGTVTDHETSLMWSRSDNQGNISWREARQWVLFTFPYSIPTLYNDWRMPTVSELATLVPSDPDDKGYESTCGQRVRIVPRIRLSCGWVWSAETSAIQALVFNFQRGVSYSDRMAHRKAYRALAVRTIE